MGGNQQEAQSVSRVLFRRSSIYAFRRRNAQAILWERDGQSHMLPGSCAEWGLHDGRVARPPVRSYRTFPPLPFGKTKDFAKRRYLSVALALESPPPAVNWHPALRRSDFPHGLFSQAPRPSNCLTCADNDITKPHFRQPRNH